MKTVEIEGKTVEEAVENALLELSAKREEVKVEILEEGSKGLFGLGGKSAKVKVSLQTGGMEKAREISEKILELMGFSSAVEVSSRPDNIYVEVKDSFEGLLIGKSGQTLYALEFLVNRLVNRGETDRYRVTLDVEGYSMRREKTLVDLAGRMAEKVRTSGQSQPLEPMNSVERRIVHMALKDDKTIKTESAGEGSSRHVVIIPAE